MDLTPFTINYWYNNQQQVAEIHPCCKEENVVDYAVWINGKITYTIRQSQQGNSQWQVALRNADHEVDPGLIQAIGNEIGQHYKTRP